MKVSRPWWLNIYVTEYVQALKTFLSSHISFKEILNTTSQILIVHTSVLLLLNFASLWFIQMFIEFWFQCLLLALRMVRTVSLQCLQIAFLTFYFVYLMLHLWMPLRDFLIVSVTTLILVDCDSLRQGLNFLYGCSCCSEQLQYTRDPFVSYNI